MGVDTSRDKVYPDLAFALPTPPESPSESKVVGLGVMAYYGGNEERPHADSIHACYVAKLKQFARWLAGDGWQIRLFIGDAVDEAVAREVMIDLRTVMPELDEQWVVYEQVQSLEELTIQMSKVGVVVATRYHNVVCALKASRPTISLGYAPKNGALMAQMGLEEFLPRPPLFRR